MKKRCLGFIGLVLTTIVVQAQDGNAGISQANQMVRSYFDTGITLLYACGGIMGLIGGIKAFYRLIKGDHGSDSAISGWLIACGFLVVVATVLRAFFGL